MREKDGEGEGRGGRDLRLEGDKWRAQVRESGRVGEEEEGGGGGSAPDAIPSRPQGTVPR